MTKDLKNYAGEDKVVDSKSFYEKVKLMPKEPRMMFGLKSLDFITEGFAIGNLITVSGYTGFGKTTFCQTVSYNLAQDKIQSLWLSYELSARQFFRKYKDENVPLFYLPEKNVPYDLNWVEEKIIESKQKFGLQVVFIDHLHYVVPMLSTQDKKSDLIGDAMRIIKLMATKHEVAIFLMAHTRQPKGTEAPVVGDIRDSSFVAQESDIVLLMHRPSKRGARDEYQDFGICNVVKLRDGGRTGKVKLEVHDNMFYEQIDLESEKAL